MSERLLALYDQKIVQCCKQYIAVDYELKLIRESYTNGLLKSKKDLKSYINRAEIKKSELLQLQDDYFRKMILITSKRSILN